MEICCERCKKTGSHNTLFVPDSINAWLCMKCRDLWEKKYDEFQEKFLQEERMLKDESYGKEVIITGPVICKDGKKFKDYTWEEHIQLLGLSLSKEEKENEKTEEKPYYNIAGSGKIFIKKDEG